MLEEYVGGVVGRGGGAYYYYYYYLLLGHTLVGGLVFVMRFKQNVIFRFEHPAFSAATQG